MKFNQSNVIKRFMLKTVALVYSDVVSIAFSWLLHEKGRVEEKKIKA